MASYPHSIAAILVLAGAGCILDQSPRDTGPHECPDTGSRFVPNIDPSLAYERDDYLPWCETPTGIQEGMSEDNCLVYCTTTFCPEAYDRDTYCVLIDSFLSWAEAPDGTYNYGAAVGDPNDALRMGVPLRCGIACTPGYVETK